MCDTHILAHTHTHTLRHSKGVVCDTGVGEASSWGRLDLTEAKLFSDKTVSQPDCNLWIDSETVLRHFSSASEFPAGKFASPRRAAAGCVTVDSRRPLLLLPLSLPSPTRPFSLLWRVTKLGPAWRQETREPPHVEETLQDATGCRQKRRKIAARFHLMRMFSNPFSRFIWGYPNLV